MAMALYIYIYEKYVPFDMLNNRKSSNPVNFSVIPLRFRVNRENSTLENREIRIAEAVWLVFNFFLQKYFNEN